MIEYIDIFVNLCPLQILKISYNVEIDIIEYIDTANLCQLQIPKTSHNAETNMIEYIDTRNLCRFRNKHDRIHRHLGFMLIADSQNITILCLCNEHRRPKSILMNLRGFQIPKISQQLYDSVSAASPIY